MASWRDEALKRLPELREVIASADSVMGLWIELWYAFNLAYEAQPRNESLIARTYSFADWCVDEAPRNPDAAHDPFTAVVVSFWEHIPTFALARDDMPRWFEYSQVAEDRAIFSYMIGDVDYAELLSYMANNRHLYHPRTPEP